MNKRKYKSKWELIGINTKHLKKIYAQNRSRANTILKNKYKKEYSIILNKLMFKDYIKIGLNKKIKKEAIIK